MTTIPSSVTGGTLYLVGVGPGDPELMTVKALRVLEQTKVWAVPMAKENGSSSALQIAAGLVSKDDREILSLCFPMKKVFLGKETDEQLVKAWNHSADEVAARLDQGLDVAFPTLGDPALYSTAFYLLAVIREKRPQTDVKVIPGIAAMSACAASQAIPLALGDDVLTVVPAAFEEDDKLRHVLATMDSVALMKVHRRFDSLLDILEDLGLTDRALLAERAGLPGEQIYRNVREARGKKLHYFSTMLIRKKEILI